MDPDTGPHLSDFGQIYLPGTDPDPGDKMIWIQRIRIHLSGRNTIALQISYIMLLFSFQG